MASPNPSGSGLVTGACALLGGGAGFLAASMISGMTGEKASDSPLTGLGILFGLLGGAAVGASISAPAAVVKPA